MIVRSTCLLLATGAVLALEAIAAPEPPSALSHRWTIEQAWAWYRQHPWIVGFNYVPSTAANTTEFWSAETFDPETIGRELGWGAGLGFNSCRVFVQYLVWNHDPAGLKQRLERFLALADRHGLTTTLVLFDDCAFGDPPQTEPFLGKQRDPIPGMILPSWTPSPGLAAVTNQTVWPQLAKYIQDVVGAFGRDRRVLLWDLYNEPGNSGLGNRSLPLVEATFAWARTAAPSQPLTIGVWGAPEEISRRQLELSDVTSFHFYGDRAGLWQQIARFKGHGRPVINTEWMARLQGSRWETDLPLFKREAAGCYNWGLVNGRTQCQFAWFHPRGTPEPKIWFHDLFHRDGRPYDPAEHDVIRRTTASKAVAWSAADWTKPQTRPGLPAHDEDGNCDVQAGHLCLTAEGDELQFRNLLLGELPPGVPPPLRAPAVPLVTHDPYFSIWSPADKLTDADTVHWTGRPHRLTSLVRVDGVTYRLMGRDPADLPPARQAVSVAPTRTVCSFACGPVAVSLIWVTPALPDDLDLLSRPLTYLLWEADSMDNQVHEVSIYFDAAAEIAVNDPAQAVSWRAKSLGELAVIEFGSEAQPVLARKGDDLRVDWGRCYTAAPQTSHPQRTVAARAISQQAFVTRGRLPEDLDRRMPRAANDEAPAAAWVLDLGRVGSKPVNRWLLLAYDDEYSIKYFRQNLRPYWRRHGADPAALLEQAGAGDTALATNQRCALFDRQLMDDLRAVGGEKYAQLCALAYRQTLAGNKIVADANGQPLMFPKENFSNGCIGTVDVLFPQAPFFLVFSPALTKAMLVPVLDYAASPRWPYPYAPHDLGTYPHATGQVYGMGGQDGDRMPVEECGNMLIMLAALARIEGNADLAKPYWPMLEGWADYLVRDGLDPRNQLCSADMFGHLPRNANLALKAIIALGGYARLCAQAGKPDHAENYSTVARDYAARWQELARDEGRTRLAYDKPGTWSMKHNLIWDRVLGLDLFPTSMGDAEVAWYRKVQNPYGLPVDNRTDTCLIDWALWSIALARHDADFQALLEPLWRYADQTPSRVPLSDWFVTTDAKQKGFQARPVVGGLFIRMLADPPTWKKWAAQGANVRGPWAPIPIGPAPKEVVPTARSAPAKWRYTLEEPVADWIKPGFNDSTWLEGPGGFGTQGTPGVIIGTEWKTKQIWLRRQFTLPDRALKNPRLMLIYDEDPEVYLNGVLATTRTGWATDYEEAEIPPPALATLKPGRNLLAVRARQTYGGQSIDVGLAEDGAPPGTGAATTSPPKSASARQVPGLRRLMETPLRDPSIARGPDGTCYLTGTVEPFWGFNAGIQVWKSPDLTNWTALGFVWKYGSSPWHQPYLEKKKPLWAPEIHYLKGTFWLTYSLPGWDGTGKTSGCGLLRSTTGRPEGPYEDMHPAERLGDEIDASLFEDDDGTVFFLWHSGKIARLKPDFHGLAEPYRWLRTTIPDPNPRHHSGLCAGIFGAQSFDHVGYEGMFLFKAQGLYHLCCGEHFEGRYSCAVATSTNLFGPYGARYEALPHAGHNMFFKDDRGQWWSTYFGSDEHAPWQERAGVLPVGWGPNGRLGPAVEEH